MIPLKVSFTGLEIDPVSLLEKRCIKGVIDPTWARVRFVCEGGSVEKLDRWLELNSNGRWASYLSTESFERRIFVIAFESDVDAVMFQLSDAKNLWRTGEKLN